MDTPWAIEVRGLTKRYRKGTLANDNVDLQVRTGTIFGLLGPNGAGKTTLVRQLTGELLPTSGELCVLGVDVIAEPTEAKRHMGIVPQEAGTFEGLTLEENLRIFGQLHGLSRKGARAAGERLIKELALQEFRSTYCWKLSGGVKRKLLVAMAVIGDPKILVLDEPTTGLDPNSRREVWSIIRTFQRGGATILLTTHYMEEAEALCNEVAIIGQGRVLACGTIDEIRSLSSRRFKVTYEEDRQAQVHYGQTHAEVAAFAEDLGLAEYTVSKTSLEDLYLELTRKPEPEAEPVA